MQMLSLGIRVNKGMKKRHPDRQLTPILCKADFHVKSPRCDVWEADLIYLFLFIQVSVIYSEKLLMSPYNFLTEQSGVATGLQIPFT